MIRDFSVTPKPKNKNAKYLMCLFFALSIASLVVSFFLKQYKGVVGMITFASLITAILIYTKYVAVIFHKTYLGENIFFIIAYLFENSKGASAKKRPEKGVFAFELFHFGYGLYGIFTR